jgi:aryl-alcohol dehydrogenase-like predicted oxidoreductase
VKYRPLGRTGWNVSEVSFGAWAIGGSWGEVSEQDALAALNKPVDCGVNFIDTADVYGDGRSERLIAATQEKSQKRDHRSHQSGATTPQTNRGWLQPTEP